MTIVTHTLDTRLFGTVSILVPTGWEDGGFLVCIGEPGTEPLVRIHSRCAYAEVLGSVDCDCAAQLAAASQILAREGGYLAYLDQEGRDAGTTFKARAYSAKESAGVDTFTFYRQSGLEEDPRDFRHVGRTLRKLGITRLRLLTNNPKKVSDLASQSLLVNRVPFWVDADPKATAYLAAKRAHGHLA